MNSATQGRGIAPLRELFLRFHWLERAQFLLTLCTERIHGIFVRTAVGSNAGAQGWRRYQCAQIALRYQLPGGGRNTVQFDKLPIRLCPHSLTFVYLIKVFLTINPSDGFAYKMKHTGPHSLLEVRSIWLTNPLSPAFFYLFSCPLSLFLL